MLEAAAEDDRACGALGELRVVGRRVGEEGREQLKRLRLAAVELAAAVRDASRVFDVALPEGRDQVPDPLAVGAEPAEDQARLGVARMDERPRGDQEVN